MDAKAFSIVCDGCVLPASPEHIAARMERLELATRFRPIHIHRLFVALDPSPLLKDDFYRPPESRDFFDAFLSALNISPDAEVRETRLETAKTKSRTESDGCDGGPAMLLEFQKRGYYLTYLSECPVTQLPSAGQGVEAGGGRECISRLAPTLIKRIQFNYRPKHVVLLGTHLSPLIGALAEAGLGPLLFLDRGAPLTIPNTGDGSSVDLFRGAVSIETSCTTTSLGGVVESD
jgi:hypothetical protein